MTTAPRSPVPSRLRWPLAGLGIVYLAGVAGYLALGESGVDALYKTVVVLTTIGFGGPDLTATEKIFTSVLAIAGVSVYLAFFAALAVAIGEGELGLVSRRKRMERAIDAMRDHFIICAYGRVGRTIAREFEAERVPFVVLDRDELLEEQMRLDGVPHLIGDPTSERVLRDAGVERAKGLVCAVDSDADNVYIVLTGRSINPSIFIVARASEADTPERLYRAGADRVISPYVTSGRHMALMAIRPRVVDYLEMGARDDLRVRVEELLIESASPLIGRAVSEVCGEAKPLVIRRDSGETIVAPGDGESLRAGDLVVLLGDPGALRTVEGA